MLGNHNRLLSMYEGCIGGENRFTKKAGRCLVSAAERDGVQLVAVTLNAPDDWNDHKALLDYGFSLLHEYPVEQTRSEFSVPVGRGPAGYRMGKGKGIRPGGAEGRGRFPFAARGGTAAVFYTVLSRRDSR